MSLLAALALGVVHPTPAEATPPSALSVDVAATPPGWVPVDVGDARISVPRGWEEGPPQLCPSPSSGAPGVVYLGTPPSGGSACSAIGPANQVTVVPFSWYSFTNSSERPSLVHGIPVYPGFGSPSMLTEQVPAIGVDLSASGPEAGAVLATLTRSPRAVVMGPGPAPHVPGSWRRLHIGGIALSVPANWPVTRSTYWFDCPRTLPTSGGTPAVVLAAGTTPFTGSCPPPLPFQFVMPPADLVEVDPGPFGPLPSGAPTGRCLEIHGLHACSVVTDLENLLLLQVRVPGQHRPVAVEIGLAGTGQTARTILWSMAPAS